MNASEGEIEISELKSGEIAILKIKGRLDAISSPLTEKRVLEYIQSGRCKLLFDMAQVDYISSSGMRMLLSTTKKLKGLSGKLILCSVTNNVMDVLKMSGFDHVLDLARTEEDAIKKF